MIFGHKFGFVTCSCISQVKQSLLYQKFSWYSTLFFCKVEWILDVGLIQRIGQRGGKLKMPLDPGAPNPALHISEVNTNANIQPRGSITFSNVFPNRLHEIPFCFSSWAGQKTWPNSTFKLKSLKPRSWSSCSHLADKRGTTNKEAAYSADAEK